MYRASRIAAVGFATAAAATAAVSLTAVVAAPTYDAIKL